MTAVCRSTVAEASGQTCARQCGAGRRLHVAGRQAWHPAVRLPRHAPVPGHASVHADRRYGHAMHRPVPSSHPAHRVRLVTRYVRVPGQARRGVMVWLARQPTRRPCRCLCASYKPRSGCRVFRVAGRWRIPALWAPGSDYVITITARSDYVIARRPVTMAGMVPGGLERPDRDPVAGVPRGRPEAVPGAVPQ
jgi:hypothetical protein